MKKPLTVSEAGEALKSLTENDSVNGFAIFDPDGSPTDGKGGLAWGVGLTMKAAWRSFTYPALNLAAHKKAGWTCRATRLRAKKKEDAIPKVPCRHCASTGRAPLSPRLWRTLERLQKLGPSFAPELREANEAGCSVNNRLVSLERVGLVKRKRKVGFWIEWEAVKV